MFIKQKMTRLDKSLVIKRACRPNYSFVKILNCAYETSWPLNYSLSGTIIVFSTNNFSQVSTWSNLHKSMRFMNCLSLALCNEITSFGLSPKNEPRSSCGLEGERNLLDSVLMSFASLPKIYIKGFNEISSQ